MYCKIKQNIRLPLLRIKNAGRLEIFQVETLYSLVTGSRTDSLTCLETVWGMTVKEELSNTFASK